jgi:hypothetical protein
MILDHDTLRAMLEDAQVAAAILAVENPAWLDLWFRLDAALTVLRARPEAPPLSPETHPT